jgi:methyl-accepting chemotaxis protein
MSQITGSKNRSFLYAVIGFCLGIGAPIAWTVVRLVLFFDASSTVWVQIVSDVTKSSYNMALYTYMGIGTAIVMALLGYYIGKGSDELHERAVELDSLHREVASQKEIFENRYKILDNNIKNFHQISSRIQKSLNAQEVLSLCAEGLHDILGYERVNILMLDEERTKLCFVTATGSEGYDTTDITLPLDERSGVIYKCFSEKRLFLVDDVTKCPESYHLKPPFDTIKPLRSRNFVICPIVIKGESVGVFGIDNKFSHRDLNDTDVDTIKLFSDQAASAITKINLLQAIDTLTVELERSFADLLMHRESHSRHVLNLKAGVESVADSTSHIASASESVMASVDETSSAVGEISVAIEQVTRNLDCLSESVDKSVSAMEEISVSLKNVEQNTAVSHQVSSQVNQAASRSKVVVEETIAALADIQKSVDLSYNGIKRLTDNSSRIDSIVNVISDITKRTNLLALNASIIAAQAGEYGKSFGVVADEIRNLSLQTGRSTGEITSIIEEIMNESRVAAGNVTVTKDLVLKGVALGHETGEALRMILESSDRAMDMTEEIKGATGEQTRSVQLVKQSIEDVSTMTSQIFNASKEQSNATKSIARAIDSIKEMTHEMVEATGQQVENGGKIRKSVDEVGQMVIGIFDDLEERRIESQAVVQELEVIKKGSA